MGFYIESNDRPHKSGLVTENVPLGALVVEDTNGVRLAAGADDDFDGVADNPRREDWIGWDNYYSTSDFEYKASDPQTGDAHRAAYGGDADGDRIKVLVGADDASLSNNTHAVIPDKAGYEGKVVEEGYLDPDDGTTVYSRSDGNVLYVGKVYRDEGSALDDVVRVEVRS